MKCRLRLCVAKSTIKSDQSGLPGVGHQIFAILVFETIRLPVDLWCRLVGRSLCQTKTEVLSEAGSLKGVAYAPRPFLRAPILALKRFTRRLWRGLLRPIS